jgi:hypothetical protein
MLNVIYSAHIYSLLHLDQLTISCGLHKTYRSIRVIEIIRLSPSDGKNVNRRN